MYPGAIPSYAGFTSSHTLAADSHASQHNSEQADIVALATKLGTGASTPASGLLLRSSGAGVSAWAQVNLASDGTGVLPQANGGTGTTLATGTGKAVYDTSPTVVTPTIASFANSNHDHTNSAGGGQLGTNALQNGAVTQAKRGAVTKVGILTTTASTPNSISVTGVGFRPSAVIFMHVQSTHVSASVQNFGLGWSDGTTSGATSLRGIEAGDFSGAVSTVFTGAVGSTGGAQTDTLTLSSMDTDGFTVAVTNNSSENTKYLYLAIG